MSELFERLQITAFCDLLDAASLMQAVVDAVSMNAPGVQGQAKPELTSEDVRLIQAAATANRNSIYQPVFQAMLEAIELGPQGIEATLTTASLLVFLICEAKPNIEQRRATYKRLLSRATRSARFWDNIDRRDAEVTAAASRDNVRDFTSFIKSPRPD